MSISASGPQCSPLLVFRKERLLYSTGKSSTCCKRRKAPSPPLLPFSETLGSNHVTWHNFTEPYFMHHWTSYWGPGRKVPPPFLPFCEILGSNHVIDITLPNHISCIIEHPIGDLAEKPPSPLPPSPPSLPVSLPPSPSLPPLPHSLVPPSLPSSLPPSPSSLPPSSLPPSPSLPPPRTGKFFLDWIYPFHAISSNFGFRWQKDQDHTAHVEYPWFP